MAVMFLTMRVKQLDEDYWNKLEGLLKYIRGTVCIPLMLKAEG
jgi:hypothetical protein